MHKLMFCRFTYDDYVLLLLCHFNVMSYNFMSIKGDVFCTYTSAVISARDQSQRAVAC